MQAFVAPALPHRRIGGFAAQATPRTFHHVRRSTVRSRRSSTVAIAQSDRYLAAHHSDAARPGTTYLVGSGPGSLDHLTFRAARLLSTADVIVTDALADSELLTICRDDAEIYHVGKRGGDARSVPQADICNMLVSLHADNASQRSVVRLKAGDVTLFGRASEELRALRIANMSLEIVPGVTSVSAAAAASGISLTERDVGRSVATVSGHLPDELDYVTLSRMDVITILMAGKSLGTIVERLQTIGGVESDRRIVVVKWATRADHEIIIRGMLRDIMSRCQTVLPNGNLSPCVVIVHKHET